MQIIARAAHGTKGGVASGFFGFGATVSLILASFRGQQALLF
jgi:hypothetical protein